MKTTKSSSKLSAFSGLTMLIALLLLIASCKKEQSLPWVPDYKPKSDIKEKSDQLMPVPELLFSGISITHIAVNTLTPDYNVTVYSDGRVRYQGRKNVFVHGLMTFRLTPSALKQLNQLTKMFDQKQGTETAEEAERAIGYDKAITTIFNKEGIKIHTDKNDIPRSVSNIRAKMEQAIGIEKYIRNTLPKAEIAE